MSFLFSAPTDAGLAYLLKSVHWTRWTRNNEPHAIRLKIPLDEDGFFLVKYRKLAATERPLKRIFMVGTVQQPMSIAETITHASAAAMKALISMIKQS